MDALEKHKKELLRKFIDGNISKDERHQLERLALDDPFLFEALEGYSYNGDQDTLKTIDHIDLSNADSTPTPVLSSYKPMRRLLQIAAGFILLAAVGYFINNEITTNESQDAIFVESDRNNESVPMVQDLSKNETPKIELELEKTPLNEDSSSSSSSSSSSPAETSTAAKTKATKKMKRESPKTPEVNESIPEPVVAAQAIEQDAESIDETVETPSDAPIQKDDVTIKGSRQKATDYYVDGIRVRAEAEHASVEKNEMDDEVLVDMTSGFSGPYNMSGVVFDKAGGALIGATVIDNITGKTVQSDIEGNFNIELPQQQSMLLVKQTGYPDQYFIANHAFQNNTVMEEIPPMDEIFIPEEQTKDTYAEPEIGLDQLFEKLEEFKLTNQTCQDRRVFIIKINESGQLIDLYRPRTKKDLCDLDLFQYLKQLGKWRTTPANKPFLHRLEINFNTN